MEDNLTHEAHSQHPSHHIHRYTFGCLVPMVLVIFGFYAVYCLLGTSPPNPAERYMSDPVDAVEYYLKTVDDYLLGGRGVYAKNVMFCVTEEDHAWFNKYYREIAASHVALDMSPEKEKSLTGGELALHKLLGAGPRDRKAEIELVNTAVTLATCKVNETHISNENIGEPVEQEKEFIIELRKENGLWKIKDFAGVKGRFE